MKVMQSKQLQSCSKTGLKKSSVYTADRVILVFILFLAQPVLLSSLDVTHTLFNRESSFSIRLTMVDFPVHEVREVFRNGETSQVKFEVRLFKESTGIWSFMGDELLAEHSGTYTGSFDPFYDMYLLQTSDNSHEFVQEENFFSAFRSFYTSFDIPATPESRMYVRARITFTPRKLMPPLNVLEPFLLDSRESTGWIQIPIPKEPSDRGGSA